MISEEVMRTEKNVLARLDRIEKQTNRIKERMADIDRRMAEERLFGLSSYRNGSVVSKLLFPKKKFNNIKATFNTFKFKKAQKK